MLVRHGSQARSPIHPVWEKSFAWLAGWLKETKGRSAPRSLVHRKKVPPRISPSIFREYLSTVLASLSQIGQRSGILTYQSELVCPFLNPPMFFRGPPLIFCFTLHSAFPPCVLLLLSRTPPLFLHANWTSFPLRTSADTLASRSRPSFGRTTTCNASCLILSFSSPVCVSLFLFTRARGSGSPCWDRLKLLQTTHGNYLFLPYFSSALVQPCGVLA